MSNDFSKERTDVGLRLLVLLLVSGVSTVFVTAIPEAQVFDKAATLRPVAEWTRYKVKDGEFSFSLPAPPALTTHETGYFGGRQDHLRHQMAAYHQGVVYIVHVYDSKKSADDLLRSFRPKLNRDLKRDLSLFGMTGKEFGFESATAKGVAQFFTSKKRSYVFAAFSSILGNAEVDLPQFFDSIKFERRTDSKVLVEGPSAAQSTYTTPPLESDAVTYRGSEVTGKAMVISKPEPMYTEAARQAQIRGNVVLRCVFSASGEVTNIKPVNGLSHGLTESAIAAARLVKFIPPIKDGRFVSIFVQIEYNFNIY